MRCQHVDRAALAVDAVGDFDADSQPPPVSGLDDSPDQARMRLVHQAIEIATAPSKQRAELCIELARQSPQLADGDGLDPTSFNERHEPLGDAGAGGQIALTPTEAVAKGTKAVPHADVAHGRRMMTTAYAAIIQQPCSSCPANGASGTQAGPISRLLGCVQRGVFVGDPELEREGGYEEPEL